MLVSREKIIEDVSLILECGIIMQPDDSMTPVISESLMRLIEDEFVSSVSSEILRANPADLYGDALPIINEPVMNEDGSGYIELPINCLRIVAFRMKGWHRTLHETLRDDDRHYALLMHGPDGIRGTAENPVIGLTTGIEAYRLEFSGCDGDDIEVEIALYMPNPRFDSNRMINVPDRLYRKVIYNTSCKVVALSRDGEFSKLIDKISDD